MMNDDTPRCVVLDRHVPPEWLCELQASVRTYRGSVQFGQTCLIQEET